MRKDVKEFVVVEWICRNVCRIGRSLRIKMCYYFILLIKNVMLYFNFIRILLIKGEL